MDIKKSLSSLYEVVFGNEPDSFVAIPQAGSDRRYYRLGGVTTHAIGTWSHDTVENRCFVALSRSLKDCGVSVPLVYAHSDDFCCYLQEDLGEVSLFDLLKSEEAEDMVRDALSALVKMQKAEPDKWLPHCIAKPFSRRQVMWDLNYFKYEFLKPSGVMFDEEELEKDFERMASRLLSVPAEFSGFMMRDCQSRNVMVHDGRPVFIDFQGGRLGPALYDAVSFLWQARAGFKPDFRKAMLSHYASEYCRGNEKEAGRLLSHIPDFVIFRTLQVLGAYGFRGLVQHRAHFILSIPAALQNLRECVEAGWLDTYPELKRVCASLCLDPRFKTPDSSSAEIVGRKLLTVQVYSFSYKKGYPDDFSGNGGGFMFDCRAMHNPGRYDEYKSLTGRDEPVIDFLEKRGEVRNFLHAAWSLVDPAVERYISRGFSSLQIGFGCTGGQHRSVYCAERTAAHLRRLFPEANITLTHREQP